MHAAYNNALQAFARNSAPSRHACMLGMSSRGQHGTHTLYMIMSSRSGMSGWRRNSPERVLREQRSLTIVSSPYISRSCRRVLKTWRASWETVCLTAACAQESSGRSVCKQTPCPNQQQQAKQRPRRAGGVHVHAGLQEVAPGIHKHLEELSFGPHVIVVIGCAPPDHTAAGRDRGTIADQYASLGRMRMCSYRRRTF